MQEYEGYFEGNHFYPIGQTIVIPERRRAFVRVLDEPARDRNKTEHDALIQKKLAALAECYRIADEAPDEVLRLEDFPRFDLGRELIHFEEK
jgi:hypothetical protein